MSERGNSPWKISTIGEVATLNPPKPKYREIHDEDLVGFVPMAAVDEVSGSVADIEKKPLGELRKKGYRTFAPNDVIFAKITPCMENGKSAVVPDLPNGHGFGSTEFHVIRPGTEVDPRYLWRFIRQQSYRSDAESQMTGSVGQARVPVSFVQKSKIPLPPIDEQRRIVARLAEIDTRRAAAMRHIDRTRTALSQFQQAVLTAACSGRLTEDWRAERTADTTAPQLAPQEIDAPREWPVVSLEELTEMVTSGSRGWAKYYADEGATFIRAQNISGDVLDLSDVAYVQLPGRAEGLRTRVRPGDLLVTITGANVTKTAYVPEEIGEAYVNQHVALVRPRDTRMTRFLHLWLTSQGYGRDKLLSDAYGAGKPGLNLTNIKTVPVALPPVAEQLEIMHRVDKLLGLSSSILARAESAHRTLDRSGQAVLAKAFSGDLELAPS